MRDWHSPSAEQTQTERGTPRISSPEVSIGGGHRLKVRDWGAGPPVLLLAGWAMDSRIWAEVMLALNEQGTRTIAYDSRDLRAAWAGDSLSLRRSQTARSGE